MGKVWNGFEEQASGQSRKVDVTDDELAKREEQAKKEAAEHAALQGPVKAKVEKKAK